MGLNVLVVGLGEVGLPTALYCQKMGLSTLGLDIDEVRVAEAKLVGLEATSSWDDVHAVDVYLICVTTKTTNGRPDIDAVFSVCQSISETRSGKTPIIVSIESTVPPFTSQYVWDAFFEEATDVFVAHVPQRYWKDDPRERGVRRLRLLSAVTEEAVANVARFYSNHLHIPFIQVPSEVAELAKVTENAYRYTQIAFAEELSMLCQELNIDFGKVREAIMTASHTHTLPEAREGIGGSCLPMAAEWLSHISWTQSKKTDAIINAAIDIDAAYRRWLAE